ncbi:MAG: addiction module protein [Candidatus Sabulitectum sp.]|nr:addiction module protein [Candidatus Sabulitectum sp.]
MEISFQLEKMTVLEKLQTIEEIWKNLAESSNSIPSPSWHNDVLLARAGRVEEGSSQFSDWSEAKDRIRDKTR